MLRDEYEHLPQVERKRIAPTPSHWLRLHRLERPHPLPPQIRDDIVAQMIKLPINHYPDYQSFHGELSRWIGFPVDWVAMGAGIEDFIRSLIMLTCRYGDCVSYTWPTCAMFDVYAKIFDLIPNRIVPHPAHPMHVDELISKLAPGTRLLILPNPGQPVSNCIPPDDMRALAAYCLKHGITLAIDEAYFGFGARSCIELVRHYENIVVLRTFSKLYGAASARFGYAVGSGPVLKALNAIRLSGEITGPTIEIARVLIKHERLIAQEAMKIGENRENTVVSLRQYGHTVHNSWANHFLIDCGRSSARARVQSALFSRKVLVKGDFPEPLGQYLLVTVGDREMMAAFLDRYLESNP